MDDRLTSLKAMLDKTSALVAACTEDQLRLPTPCGDFDVEALVEHIAVWIQVFDAAVNEQALEFDPATHRVGKERPEAFARAARSIMVGLQERGYDRPMTMTSDPVPGEFILNMLLMEYVGHGWDLSTAVSTPSPYSDDEAAVALSAAQAIIQPQYRGTGMFDHEIAVLADTSPIDQLVAFLGRNPEWEAPVAPD